MTLVTHVVDRERQVIGQRMLHAEVVEREVRRTARDIRIGIRHRSRCHKRTGCIQVVARVQDLRSRPQRRGGRINISGTEQRCIRKPVRGEGWTVVQIERRGNPCAGRDFRRPGSRDVEPKLTSTTCVAAASADTASLREYMADSGTEHRLRIRFKRQANAWTPVLPVRLHRCPAAAAHARAPVVAGELDISGIARRRVCLRRVQVAPAILHLVERRQIIPAQSRVHRKLRADLPGVLHIRRHRPVSSANLAHRLQPERRGTAYRAQQIARIRVTRRRRRKSRT